MRAFLIATVFALCVTACGGAASDEPSPSSGAGVEKPKSHTQQNKQRPARDQRGTESTPPVVKALPSLGANDPAANHSQEQHDYSSGEWWLVYLTAALSIFTFGLMLYTASVVLRI